MTTTHGNEALSHPWGRRILGIYRIVVGFLFACHGASTLFGVPAAPDGRVVVAVGSWPLWWAAIIELLGGLLVMVGLLTRVAALICSGAMAYAYFSVHLQHGILPIANGGEPAALFCWSFLLVAFAGPGAYSLQSLRKPRTTDAAAAAPRTPTGPVSDGIPHAIQSSGREQPRTTPKAD